MAVRNDAPCAMGVLLPCDSPTRLRSRVPVWLPPFPASPLSMNGYSDRINHAFAFAAKYYGAVAPAGAGMDYLAHPANVAVILAREDCDHITIVFGILHH